MVTVEVQQRAYVKVLLHALKYPAAAVNGVFLGECSRKQDSVQITVVEAVPLLHAHIALSPMMDAAFCLLDEYCRKKGLSIIGYYHANSSLDQVGAPPLARRIADKIQETVKEGDKNAETCLVVVNNQELELLAGALSRGQLDESAYKLTGIELFTRGTGGWAKSDALRVEGSDVGAAQSAVKQQLAEGRLQELVDFDNHLDDPSRGWLPA